MAARPLHVFEAGVVTEQQFAGLQEAPAILGPALAERLGAEKRVRIPFNPRDRWLTAAREACRTLADGVQASLREGATAAVIGGECTVIAGALGGALSAEPELSLVYCDAHGDFNTLATTPSHYIPGMMPAPIASAVMRRRWWMRSSAPGDASRSGSKRRARVAWRSRGDAPTRARACAGSRGAQRLVTCPRCEGVSAPEA